MRVVTVANLKGGTGKTTTAAYLAHAWHWHGRRVLLVDADPAGSALRWSEMAAWPLPALGLAVRDLHGRLDTLGMGYDVVVVDTPPLDEQRGIVGSAVRAADHVVVPVAPTTMELDRLSPILDVVDDVAPLRATPPLLSIMLVRVVSQANSDRTAREVISSAGFHVLETQVPRLERYAQAFGAPVHAEGTEYLFAAAELDRIEVRA